MMDISQTKRTTVNWRFVCTTAAVLVGAALAAWWFPGLLHPQVFGGDWRVVFRPAVETALAGGSPFSVAGYFNPPWLLPFLLPFALLPHPVDMLAIIVLGACALLVSLRRLGASWFLIVLFAFTPQVIGSLMYGNVDFLVALGFVLPPPVGMILVSVKPQIGAPIALFWTVEAWRKGGIREAARVCAPTAALALLSFAVYGWWLPETTSATGMWNYSPFPYFVPAGIILLIKAIRERKAGLSISSAPFLTPYLNWNTITLAVMGLLPNELEVAAAVVGLWIAFALQTAVPV